MNKINIFFGAMLLLIVWLNVISITQHSKPKAHICIDPTHQTCDGKCTCDGMECYTHYHNGQECRYEGAECPTIQFTFLRDYQIELLEDSFLIFDGKRYVGSIPFGNGGNNQKMNSLDSLIERDNE